MNKYYLVITVIFTIFMISGSRAEDDFSDEISNRQTERRDKVSEIEDQKSTARANLSENTGDGQIKQNVNDKRNDFYDERSSNYNQYNRNDNRYGSRSTTSNYIATRRNNNNLNYNRNNIGYDNVLYNGNRGYNNPPPARMAFSSIPPPVPLVNNVNPNLKDFSSGLSFGTLKILSTLPKCDQQTLLNYRRLLRNPLIRLQFYRDLYQMKQRNYVDGCGEGLVKIGYRERAILLRDPYFRKKVEVLMARQPVGVAIRGAINYPNDIGGSAQPLDPILTLNKRY